MSSQSACERKTRWKTLYHATEAARRIIRDGKEVEPYRCPDCGGAHLANAAHRSQFWDSGELKIEMDFKEREIAAPTNVLSNPTLKELEAAAQLIRNRI